MCLENWKKHSSATGGYFRCNRFEAVHKADEKQGILISEVSKIHSFRTFFFLVHRLYFRPGIDLPVVSFEMLVPVCPTAHYHIPKNHNPHTIISTSNLTFIQYRIFRTIRRTMIFSLDILEKNNDECILILVIYWKKTVLVHTKISNHNIIYSS